MPDNDTTLNTVYTDYADPDKMPHPEGYLGDENTPAPMSSWTDLNDRRPIYLYFLPSADSQEVYQYSTMSWIPRSSVPVGGVIVNMFSCANPAGGDFTGREACEQNALRLRADQKTRAIETSDPHFWDSRVNYVTGNLTNRNGVVWRSLGDNGPDMPSGVRDPLYYPDDWVTSQTIHSPVVAYIDYRSTVPGIGTASNPCRNLAEFMRVYGGLAGGTAPFMSNNTGHVDTPTVFVYVRGPETVVEQLDFGLHFENKSLIFSLDGVTSWTLTTLNTSEMFVLHNSYLSFRNTVTTSDCSVHILPLYTYNSYVLIRRHCHLYIDAATRPAINAYCSGFDVQSDCAAFLTSRSNDVVTLRASDFSSTGTLHVHYAGVLNTRSGLVIDSSHVYMTGNVKISSGGARQAVLGRSAYMQCSGGMHEVSGYYLLNCFAGFSGTQLILGNDTGLPAPNYGMSSENSYVSVSSNVSLEPGKVVPARKGRALFYGVVLASGRAQDSWPGTNPWEISAQGAYLT